MKVELSLESQLMVGVEEVKSKRRFRSMERCGVPAHPQKLAIMFYPAGRPFARTELCIHVMRAVGIDDEDPLNGAGRWARSMFVANVVTEPQFEKAGALVKTVLPNLRSR